MNIANGYRNGNECSIVFTLLEIFFIPFHLEKTDNELPAGVDTERQFPCCLKKYMHNNHPVVVGR